MSEMMRHHTSGYTAAPDSPRRHDGWTEERRAIFLDTLSETAQISVALNASGMGKASLYELRRRDPHFAAQWKAALESAVDVLRAHAFESAMTVDIINKYDRDGGILESRDKINDRMLIHLLNRYDPAPRYPRAQFSYHPADMSPSGVSPSGMSPSGMPPSGAPSFGNAPRPARSDRPLDADLKEMDADLSLETLMKRYVNDVALSPRIVEEDPADAPLPPREEQDYAAPQHAREADVADAQAEAPPPPYQPWSIEEDFAIFQRWLDTAMVEARDWPVDAAQNGEPGAADAGGDAPLEATNSAPFPAVATHHIRPASTPGHDSLPPYSNGEIKALFLLWHLARRGVSPDHPHYPRALLAALNAGEAIAEDMLINSYARAVSDYAGEGGFGSPPDAIEGNIEGGVVDDTIAGERRAGPSIHVF